MHQFFAMVLIFYKQITLMISSNGLIKWCLHYMGEFVSSLMLSVESTLTSHETTITTISQLLQRREIMNYCHPE